MSEPHTVSEGGDMTNNDNAVIADKHKKALQLARKRVRDRERRFKKASPAGKRVMIAKDVLAQLAAGKIRPKPGTWVSWGMSYAVEDKFREYADENEISIFSVECNLDLRDLVLEGLVPDSCSACAMGALFMATVMRADEVKISRYQSTGMSSEVEGKLREFFNADQLRLIEIAFEKGGGAYRCHSAEDEAVAAKYSHLQAQERLEAIMQNIVANKGEFVP